MITGAKMYASDWELGATKAKTKTKTTTNENENDNERKRKRKRKRDGCWQGEGERRKGAQERRKKVEGRTACGTGTLIE
jgi:hypothetical protein